MPVLQKNQTITLEIDGYTAEGAGVGHFEGMAVFVPDTLMGEKVPEQSRLPRWARSYIDTDRSVRCPQPPHHPG